MEKLGFQLWTKNTRRKRRWEMGPATLAGRRMGDAANTAKMANQRKRTRIWSSNANTKENTKRTRSRDHPDDGRGARNADSQPAATYAGTDSTDRSAGGTSSSRCRAHSS